MMLMTKEWVSKAEGDYDVVCIMLRSRKPSRYDTICFHAQQCAEKYLKARLTEASVRFGKTHNLEDLLALTALHPSAQVNTTFPLCPLRIASNPF